MAHSKITLLLFGGACLLSCSKDDPSISSAHNRPEPLSRSTSPSAPDLFVVGWIQLTSGVKAASCKNGLITELAETTNPVQSRAGATSIFVSGSDVYVGGMGFNGVHDYAMYWKNGEAVNLTDGIEDAWVNSIFVSGTDVYVAGVVVTSGHSTAVYWKNGVATSLPDGSTAHDIVVWGTDVYVAGMTSTWNPLGPAGYWKNGVFTRLVNGIASNTIVISGSDVYVGGSIQAPSTPGVNGKEVGAYWKNGALTILSDSTKDVWVKSIAISGSDVYVAATVYGGGGKTDAVYWKNGAATTLSNNGQAHSVSISGSDVYVAGTVWTTEVACCQGTYTPVYWKNGVPVKLMEGTYGIMYEILLK